MTKTPFTLVHHDFEVVYFNVKKSDIMLLCDAQSVQ